MKFSQPKSFIYTFLLLVAILTPTYINAQEDGGQIDIKADEQEFAEDHVIAKGKVRVDYGDTVINGPIATLYRDDTGAASSAVFTGNPHLVQGKNTIRAAKLTFNVKTKSILAVGRAHSEIYTDEKTSPDDTEEKESSKKETSSSSGSDKIITDSHKQEYERESGKFEAHGNVKVRTGDITVISDHMRIVYGNNRKAESAIFTGNAEARQDKNITQADRITYFLTTQRLQATGNVRSKVIEEKSDAGDTVDSEGTKIAKTEEKENDGKIKFVSFGDMDNVDAPVYIVSDSQDYNKTTNRMKAVGNVRVIYKDTRGRGPRATLIKNKYGKAERVIFTGRSQISQPGRRWIGDRITLTLHDRKVLAEGNTKAIIVNKEDPTAPKPRRQNNNPAPDFNALSGGSKIAGAGTTR